jgi:arsenate reductase
MAAAGKMAAMSKPNILVLCTGNSCRSQMAEGWIKHLAGDRFDVHSAGTKPSGFVHPLAVQVMREAGVDISSQHSKDLKQFLGRLSVQHLIIVCGSADEECPRIFPGMMNRHFLPFDDPAALEGGQDEALAGFRRVRDEIRDRLEAWLESV